MKEWGAEIRNFSEGAWVGLLGSDANTTVIAVEKGL